MKIINAEKKYINPINNKESWYEIVFECDTDEIYIDNFNRKLERYLKTFFKYKDDYVLFGSIGVNNGNPFIIFELRAFMTEINYKKIFEFIKNYIEKDYEKCPCCGQWKRIK